MVEGVIVAVTVERQICTSLSLILYAFHRHTPLPTPCPLLLQALHVVTTHALQYSTSLSTQGVAAAAD